MLDESDGATAEPDEMADSTFQIRVPTTVELAQNLKGNLLLETGDMDNNVHPATYPPGFTNGSTNIL